MNLPQAILITIGIYATVLGCIELAGRIDIKIRKRGDKDYE